MALLEPASTRHKQISPYSMTGQQTQSATNPVIENAKLLIQGKNLSPCDLTNLLNRTKKQTTNKLINIVVLPPFIYLRWQYTNRDQLTTNDN